MREYELYIPLNYNDGRAVEPEKLTTLKQRLTEEFGGLTHFPQENEGVWKVGSFTFRDRIVIVRVLSNDRDRAEHFFAELKERLKQEWQQSDILIVERQVHVI